MNNTQQRLLTHQQVSTHIHSLMLAFNLCVLRISHLPIRCSKDHIRWDVSNPGGTYSDWDVTLGMSVTMVAEDDAVCSGHRERTCSQKVLGALGVVAKRPGS